MGYAPSERTGVLIVRVWTETDEITGLRARITRSLDITARGEVVSTAGTVDEILGTVRSWLEDFARSSQS